MEEEVRERLFRRALTTVGRSFAVPLEVPGFVTVFVAQSSWMRARFCKSSRAASVNTRNISDCREWMQDIIWREIQTTSHGRPAFTRHATAPHRAHSVGIQIILLLIVVVVWESRCRSII